jgi:hypothetical protein
MGRSAYLRDRSGHGRFRPRLGVTEVSTTPPSGEASRYRDELDLDRLLKLRLVVARHGEMDRAGWWNTNGILGRHGTIVLQRGLPRTHRFAQARVAFAVARTRCEEVFDAPGSVTLWKLPAELEDGFEEHWQAWLADGEAWTPFFDDLVARDQPDLLSAMRERDLISAEEAETVEAMRRSAEGRAVQLPGERHLDGKLITLLAAGFTKGGQGAPAIPYARLAD